MPQRSNPFQRLIYLIQHQLASDAAVTESRLLIDKVSGRNVEVDVVIEGKLGGVPLLIGIECTATKRPATVEWVDQMLGKHSSLPVDKTVLVSKTGFTPDAVTKATSRGVDVLQLSEAESRDWSGWVLNVNNLRYATFTVSPERVSAQVVAGNQADAKFVLVPASIVEEPGKESHTLNEYVIGMLRQDHILEQVSSEWLRRDLQRRTKPLTFTLNWTCPSGTTITGLSGAKLVIGKLTVNARAVANEAPFAATVSTINGQTVIHGEVQGLPLDGGSADMLVAALVQDDGHLISSAGLLREQGSKVPRVINFKIPGGGRNGDS
jgi:hypothetical protein